MLQRCFLWNSAIFGTRFLPTLCYAALLSVFTRNCASRNYRYLKAELRTEVACDCPPTALSPRVVWNIVEEGKGYLNWDVSSQGRCLKILVALVLLAESRQDIVVFQSTDKLCLCSLSFWQQCSNLWLFGPCFEINLYNKRLKLFFRAGGDTQLILHGKQIFLLPS